MNEETIIIGSGTPVLTLHRAEWVPESAQSKLPASGLRIGDVEGKIVIKRDTPCAVDPYYDNWRPVTYAEPFHVSFRLFKVSKLLLRLRKICSLVFSWKEEEEFLRLAVPRAVVTGGDFQADSSSVGYKVDAHMSGSNGCICLLTGRRS